MTSSDTPQTNSKVINALIKLISPDFSPSSLPLLLSDSLPSISPNVDHEFASFLTAVAACHSRTQSFSHEAAAKDSELRKAAVESLVPYLETFCGKFGIESTLALVGMCLRQGNFFVLQDESPFLKTLLPNAIVTRMAMALCGILTLPIVFQQKFAEYPLNFEDSLAFESACESLCNLLNLNPIVPRLAALDYKALELIEHRYGFPKRVLAWFVINLSNLPIFALEGLALREIKKMVYLKELHYRAQMENPEAEDIRPDYYDSIDFTDPLYKKPKELIDKAVSMSHHNEIFEVLLFNSEEYIRMDYAYMASKERVKSSLAIEEEGLFGAKKDYYQDLARAFYYNPYDPSIWADGQNLNLNISWLNAENRRQKKNVWEVMKRLFERVSMDDEIINGNRNGYEKITLGQLLLFVVLLRVRYRIVRLIA
eukprot:TRINITY_DN5454_c0_g1_i1.p1 TRINITY_DN5454_c0_g1~~TRINITY_DN5454_c0_g1_i1.p1  ORF type:complete len:426 (+),score=115.22 TRINITY_DN5454_c0_g1_i1:57-1334(+)